MEKLQQIADNYVNSHPLAREPALLRTLKAIASTRSLADSVDVQSEYLALVLGKLYSPTLKMINEVSDDFLNKPLDFL